MSVTVITKIVMPTPEESRAVPNPKMVLLHKVQEYLIDIEDGCQTSTYQWEYIKTLFTKLINKAKLSSFELELLDMIEPIIHKYAEYDGEFAASLDGAKMIEKMNDKRNLV